ncbi:MAG: O-antigen ligase family protein [Kiritimatiellae bacterium]|jgi:putative inorganic carbon (HCO3(-)) transporter|nr:O-antigen ligase family protein [Kiritimatiellia bacterium]
MTNEIKQTIFGRIFFYLACITILIAPAQWSVELRKGLYLSPADITLTLAAGIWLVDIALRREWKEFLRLPPWSHLIFIACAGASMLFTSDKLSAIKELVQYIEYFIVGYIVFDTFIHKYPNAVKILLFLLVTVLTGITALAAVQYFNLDLDDLDVRGTFGNRNVLAGFFALALPLLFACLIETRSWITKILLSLLLLTALSVNLSGASYIAIAITIIIIAARNGLKWFIPAATVLILWQSQVLPRLPRENDLVHFHSMALYCDDGTVARRYPDWQAAGSMILTNPFLGIGPGNYQKHVGQYYDNIPRKTGPSEPDIQNMHLVIAASMGIPALLAFLAMFIAPFSEENIFPMKHCTLIHGAIGSLAAFAFTAAWHPLLVRGIGLPFVLLLVFTQYLVKTEAINGSCIE